MKNRIADFPDFLNAVRNDKLVYLFGTGISSALSDNKSCGWWKWISRGTSYMLDKPLAAKLSKSIEDDDSADNLIKVVGQVICSTKADNTYASWMQDTIEEAPMTNVGLSEILRKLLISQDIFTTTNYDHLLEKATGLRTITYSEPNRSYEMLDSQKSNAVIHLHGTYDSAQGIDDIIADKDQYDAIIQNQGAQFIQHILGTRTLIFVGCGQTTEDGNISRFIEFSKEYLHIEKTYYFLYNSTKPPKEMPDYIRLIPYGDNNGDLPSFLNDIADERLKYKYEKNPIIERSIYTNKADAFGLSEYHFSNGTLKFCGRAVELSQLDTFLDSDAQIKWWAITGQGGSGKSRLAFELLHRKRIDWYGFFLNNSVEKDNVDTFIPFNDTIIIIDYVKGNEKHIAEIVSLLIDKYTQSSYKLRLLFLERDNLLLSGSWFQALEDGFDYSHRATFNDAEYNQNMISKEHRFLYLDDLDDCAVLDLICAICERKELPKDKARDKKLKEDYSRKFEQLKFRPLFLQIYIESWIDNGCIAVEYKNYKSMIESVVKREQERLLHIFENDISTVNALIRLIIRASISDGIEVNKLSLIYPEEWALVRNFVSGHSFAGKQRIEYLQTILSDAEHGITASDLLRPLYPDLIKEFMFIYYLDVDSMLSVSEELWENNPNEFNTFLSRCIADFQDEVSLIEFVRRSSADYTNLNAMQVRWSILQDKIIHTIDEGAPYLRMVIDEHSYWTAAPNDEKIKEIVLKGLYYSVFQFFAWSMEEESRSAIKQVIDYPCGRELLSEKARYLIECIHYLMENDGISFAQEFIRPISRVISNIENKKTKRELLLIWRREIMVSYAYDRRMGRARFLHWRIKKMIDWNIERQVEQYAYICFSGANICYHTMRWRNMLTFADWTQDLAEVYGKRIRKIYFNDKTHYYYLHSKLMRVETVAINAHLKGVGDYGVRLINEYIQEIEGNEMFSDLSGLLVGAKALKVGFDDRVSNKETKHYFSEADKLLLRYPDNALLAAKVIDLWKTAYEYQYRRKIPKNVVERAYTLVLRFPSNEDVLSNFFDMLKESVEAANWKAYVKNKGVVCGLIKHKMVEYLI